MMFRHLSLLAFLGVLFSLTACSLADGFNPPADPLVEGIITIKAEQEGVLVVRNNQREALPVAEQAVLNVEEGVIVEEQGQATLQIEHLLTAQLLQMGEITLQSFADEGTIDQISLRQAGGAAFYEFNADKSADHQLTIETEFAEITSIGARFLLVREAGDREWVVNLGEAADVLQVTAAGETQTVSSGTARWITFKGWPSDSLSVDIAMVEVWFDTLREGTAQATLGDLLFPPADIMGAMTTLNALPTVGQAFEFGDAKRGQGAVQLTLDPRGLFGSPTYTLEDCNSDGSQDIAILAGIVHFDFNSVLGRVRALDVTVINRNLPGNGALSAVDASQNEVARQLFEVGEGETQTLSLRSTQSYHTARLALVDGCFVGFSLTPPTTNGPPAPPRAIVSASQSEGVVVNVLAGSEEEEESGVGDDPASEGAFRALDRGQIEAIALEGAGEIIEIEGDVADWNVLNRPGRPSWTSFETIVFDEACSKRYPGQERNVDLRAQVRFAYDEQFLYVAFQVEDDGYVSYNGAARDYFLGDSPQLSLDIDLLSDFADTARSEDDWQVDFYPNPTRPTAVLWQLASLSSREFEEASVAVNFDGADYFVEAALPWRSLGVTPQPGDRYGLAANVNDNDTPNTNAQECIISTAPEWTWNNPTTWGTLLLRPPS